MDTYKYFYGIILLFTLGVWLGAEEPDYGNDYGSAAAITIDGTVLEGTLSSNQDEDWFSFNSNANGLYEIALTAQSGSKTVSLYYLDGSSQLQRMLYFSLGQGQASTRSVFLPDADTYYIKVSSQTGAYFISVNEEGVFPPDTYANTCLSPESIPTDGTVITGTISDNGLDEDWFSFAPAALHKYRIHFYRTDNSTQARCDLHNTGCGNRIRTVSSNSSFTLVPIASENYDLRVYTSGPTQAYYNIWIDDLGEVADDYANVYTAATPVATDGTAIGGIIQYKVDVNSDKDWFSFNSQTNGMYRLTLTSFSGYKALELYRMGPGGVLVKEFSFSSASGQVSRDVFLPEADTWYVLITSNSAEGVYQLSIDELGIYPPDDYPNTCGADPAPTELFPGDPATAGTISESFDVDWFRFQALELHKYQIILTQADNSSVRFNLYDDDCFTILRKSQVDLTLVAWTDKEFKIRLVSPTSRLSYYTIAVIDLGLQSDDHANRPDGATEIVPNNVPVEGRIQYVANLFSDEDWFSFPARHNSTYDVTLHRITGYTPTIRVYEQETGGALNEVLVFSTNNTQTKHLDVEAGKTYYCKVTAASTNIYSVAVSAPEPICGDQDHPYPVYDFNHDCYVNLVDLAYFASEWLTCSDPEPPCGFNP